MADDRQLRARLLTGSAIAVVVACLVSEGNLYWGAPGANLTLRESVLRHDPSGLQWNADVTGPFPTHLRRVGFLEPDPTPVRRLLYYFDQRYPYSFTNLPDWFGLSQHLASASLLGGGSPRVELVNSDALRGVLQDPTSTSSVLVIASGVLPGTVFSGSLDLVTPWVRAGGTLLWAGGQIGVFVGTPSGTLGCGPANLLGRAGTARFFDPGLLVDGSGGCGPSATPPDTILPNRSVVAESFGLDYPYGIGPQLFRADRVAAAGGDSLGALGAGTSNLVRLPLGSGWLYDLAAPPTDVIRLARLVSVLWQTGLFRGVPTILSVEEAELRGPGTVRFSYLFDSSATERQTLCFYTAQDDYLSAFSVTRCLDPLGSLPQNFPLYAGAG